MSERESALCCGCCKVVQGPKDVIWAMHSEERESACCGDICACSECKEVAFEISVHDFSKGPFEHDYLNCRVDEYPGMIELP